MLRQCMHVPIGSVYLVLCQCNGGSVCTWKTGLLAFFFSFALDFWYVL